MACGGRCERSGQGTDFDGVPKRRARAMHCDVLERRRAGASRVQRRADQSLRVCAVHMHTVRACACVRGARAADERARRPDGMLTSKQ